MDLDAAVAELRDERTEQDPSSGTSGYRRPEASPSDDFDDFLELLKEIRM